MRTDAMLVVLAATILSKPVTALCEYRGDVYAGMVDGSLVQLHEGDTVRTWAGPKGVSISFVSASPYGLAWLSGDGGAIREKVALATPSSETLCIDDADTGAVRTFKFQPTSPIRRMAWLQGRIAVCYDFGAVFFDAKGRTVAPETFMPREASEAIPKSSLWVREQADGTELAVFARPYSVRQNPQNKMDPLVSLVSAWQVGAWQWAKLGGFASTAFDAFPQGELKANEDGRIAGDAKFLVLSDRIALTSDGIAAKEPSTVLSAPIYNSNWEMARVPAASVPGDPLWFGAGGDFVWWWNGAALVQQNRRTGDSAAFLPWADLGQRVSTFLPDSKGIWVGSNRGLRYLDPSTPDDAIGYGGFLRTAIVAETPPSDPLAKRLTEAVFAWRFAGSDKAGPDGGVMVASVFSALGLKVPQTARELAATGAAVRGDIRFGDVLATPSSAGIYLGNGLTVELRDGRVQNADIWAWQKPAVRRFTP